VFPTRVWQALLDRCTDRAHIIETGTSLSLPEHDGRESQEEGAESQLAVPGGATFA